MGATPTITNSSRRESSTTGATAVQEFNPEVRSQVFATVVATIQRRLFDPALNGKSWDQLAASRSGRILSAPTVEEFSHELRGLLRELDLYPLDFCQERLATVPFHRLARATLHPYQDGWMLQDVHPDGPAERGGLLPGDRLLTVNDALVSSAAPVMLPPSGNARLRVLRRNGAETEVDVSPLSPAEQSTTRFVLASKLASTVGLLKITMFPGLVGIEMAKAIDRGVAELAECQRLIIDLRGNPGGGTSNLRLMSYMTSRKTPVGYSLTRRRAESGYRREDLPRFRRIPASKLGLIWPALRFKWVDKSIVVVTEGLGRKSFHGRIVLLVNEHTISGAEIVAGFAHENRLATIVGTRTAGRLLGWSSVAVGHGFRLTFPVSNYITWDGRCFENSGITPDVVEPFRPDEALAGRDNQLQAATEIARSL